MKVPQLTWTFAVALFGISIHHYIDVAKGYNVAPLTKALFYGVKFADTSLSIASWASDGCSYFPDICSLKKDIPKLEEEAKRLSEELKEKVQLLSSSHEENRETFNILDRANVNNERIVTTLEAIRGFSGTIVELLEEISGKAFSTIDPIKLEMDANALIENAASIRLQMKDMENAMEKRKLMGGISFGAGGAVQIAYYGYTARKYYKMKKAQGVDLAQSERTSVSKSVTLTGQIRTKLSSMQTWINNHPKVKMSMRVAAYGVSLLISGAMLYIDIKNSEQMRDRLRTVKQDLIDIIDGHDTTDSKVDEFLTTQEDAKASMADDFGTIKQAFLNATGFLAQLKTYPGDYYDQSLVDLPTYTAGIVSLSTINDQQEAYKSYLLKEAKNLQTVYNRFKMITAILNLINVPGYTMPLSVLLKTARQHDASTDRDLLLNIIANNQTSRDPYTWPDLNMSTGKITNIDLTPWFTLKTTTPTTTTARPTTTTRKPLRWTRVRRIRLPRVRIPRVRVPSVRVRRVRVPSVRLPRVRVSRFSSRFRGF
ncbi:unnamed protein product [Owenia fusiformis]|uniref:Uncharacterized protein n=1 Tax=Owenia fusiformis TaxID=6347 RepID=A0A8S4Q9R0_OWEFU|nr:unnamed protein product [Owenia fusiformis]